jgi:protein-S-isoprenylcysteine O-methyltransferase Ste14
MTSQMTKWGVGPKFTLYTTIYCLLMFGLTRYFDPLFKITFIPYRMLLWFSSILILLGIPFYLFSIVSVMRAFKAGKLVTSGVYGMCRHPVYSAWLVFFVPGIALLINSWALLSAPFVMYLLVRALVKKEDIYLEENFGQEYLSYKHKVPAILPYGWIKRNT